MAENKERGSDQVAHRWSERDLAELVAFHHEGVKLVEYFPKGIPAPDGGWGTWHVQPGVLSALIEALLKSRTVPGIWIFPKGIPVPDLFEVGFVAGSARER